MPDLNAIAERFVDVMPEDRREGVAKVLRTVMTAYDAGSIFNVDYKDAKDRLNYAVDQAWEEYAQKPYAWGQSRGTSEARVVYEITIMGLHDTISASKKLPKLIAAERPSQDFQSRMYAFFEATVPVALIMKDLKSKVIMGRKPAPPEVQERRAAMEAKKVIRTCPVCLRPIGLKGGLIADHGYRLPHRGWKTSSCPGGNFPPLEVSPAGVQHMVGLLTRWLADYERQLSAAPTITSITREKPHSFRGERETINPESPKWRSAYDNYVDGLKGDIRATKSSLAEFQKRLASWKPTPEGQRYGGGKRRHGRPNGIAKLGAEVRGLLRK